MTYLIGAELTMPKVEKERGCVVENPPCCPPNDQHERPSWENGLKLHLRTFSQGRSGRQVRLIWAALAMVMLLGTSIGRAADQDPAEEGTPAATISNLTCDSPDMFTQYPKLLERFVNAKLGTAGATASFIRPIIRGGLVERLRIATTVPADKMSYFVAHRAGAPLVSAGKIDSVEVLGRSADSVNSGGILLDLPVPEPLERTYFGLLWQPETYYVVGCPLAGGELVRDGKPAGLVAVATAPVSSRISATGFGLMVVVLLYCLAAWTMSRGISVRSVDKPDERERRFSGFSLNPLRFTAALTGRTSLANLQLLYFTLITVWLVCYALLRTGSWAEIDLKFLGAFGIVAAGTLFSRSMRASDRLSVPNLEWLKRWRWLEIVSPVKALFTSRGEPDVARFQAVGFGLVIGIAMIVAAFNDHTLVGDATTLLGLLAASQTTYVLGKKISPDQPDDAAITDLNGKIDAAREAERRLKVVVAQLPTQAARLTELQPRLTVARQSNQAVLKGLSQLATQAGQDQNLMAAVRDAQNERTNLDQLYGSATWPKDVPMVISKLDNADRELAAVVARVSAQPAAQGGQPDPVVDEAKAVQSALQTAQAATSDLLAAWQARPTVEDAEASAASITTPPELVAAIQAYRTALTAAGDVLEAQLDVPRPHNALYRLSLNER